MGVQQDLPPLSETDQNDLVVFFTILIQIDRRMKKEGKTYGSEGKRNSNNTN